ncbi:hypothetical protein DFH11DRAFT_1747936 [Phellopilus nigrolimitatus]|nr:hypothetical protein DFH11DRAFT_1747936 [Phellopilus nigrolimitatus]
MEKRTVVVGDIGIWRGFTAAQADTHALFGFGSGSGVGSLWTETKHAFRSLVNLGSLLSEDKCADKFGSVKVHRTVLYERGLSGRCSCCDRVLFGSASFGGASGTSGYECAHDGVDDERQRRGRRERNSSDEDGREPARPKMLSKSISPISRSTRPRRPARAHLRRRAITQSNNPIPTTPPAAPPPAPRPGSYLQAAAEADRRGPQEAPTLGVVLPNCCVPDFPQAGGGLLYTHPEITFWKCPQPSLVMPAHAVGIPSSGNGGASSSRVRAPLSLISNFLLEWAFARA